MTLQFVHLSVDSIASTGHTPINKIRGSPEDGENTSGKKFRVLSDVYIDG